MLIISVLLVAGEPSGTDFRQFSKGLRSSELTVKLIVPMSMLQKELEEHFAKEMEGLRRLLSG